MNQTSDGINSIHLSNQIKGIRNDVNDIQISISSSEVCITSTGKMLYDFFNNKESLQIKDKIKLLDENYEFLFDKDKNCSLLKLSL